MPSSLVEARADLLLATVNVPAGDEGGELDPHGADGLGNPIGGIVLQQSGNTKYQLGEWSSFLSDREFSIRACFDGPDAARYVSSSRWSRRPSFP